MRRHGLPSRPWRQWRRVRAATTRGGARRRGSLPDGASPAHCRCRQTRPRHRTCWPSPQERRAPPGCGHPAQRVGGWLPPSPSWSSVAEAGSFGQHLQSRVAATRSVSPPPPGGTCHGNTQTISCVRSSDSWGGGGRQPQAPGARRHGCECVSKNSSSGRRAASCASWSAHASRTGGPAGPSHRYTPTAWLAKTSRRSDGTPAAASGAVTTSSLQEKSNVQERGGRSVYHSGHIRGRYARVLAVGV